MVVGTLCLFRSLTALLEMIDIKSQPLRCEECGKEITQCRNKTKRFCSEQCRSINYNRNYYIDHEEDLVKKAIANDKRRYHIDTKYMEKKKIRALSKFHVPKTGECSKCGHKGKTQLHHKKYTVYDVEEVCKACHRKIHRH